MCPYLFPKLFILKTLLFEYYNPIIIILNLDHIALKETILSERG